MSASPRTSATPSTLSGRWRSPWVPLVVRLIVGGVFLTFGTAKLLDLDTTIRSVRAYQLLPEAVVPAVGSALPLVEVALGLLLVLGVLTRPVAVVTALLSLAFVVGIVSAWARGLSIECGCFGNGGFTNDPVPGYLRELAINGGVLLGCGLLLARGGGRFALDRVLGLVVDEGRADDADDTEDAEDAEDTDLDDPTDLPDPTPSRSTR
ncbi:MauE/DoxX family redox-associated membrane protein [Lapillicoccus jejuensis]|uniref:Putative membrane protein YphA (DoxX/SURF4 family) n=1 Tax=Lapillicoccus jejuensis TaxID=402171 RepID=A0A542E339_9MICO|nr:MauE/DoxX family redox-associated membrane protein [Lapillicoccus jejuensis]TQJ09747.1 putative membrane protein YphA (DoxX/SURF4 family) [Lapillicoccus jejuensis]